MGLQLGGARGGGVEAQPGYVVFFLGACGHPKPGAFGSETEGLCTNQPDQATFQSNPKNFLLPSPYDGTPLRSYLKIHLAVRKAI